MKDSFDTVILREDFVMLLLFNYLVKVHNFIVIMQVGFKFPLFLLILNLDLEVLTVSTDN